MDLLCKPEDSREHTFTEAIRSMLVRGTRLTKKVSDVSLQASDDGRKGGYRAGLFNNCDNTFLLSYRNQVMALNCQR